MKRDYETGVHNDIDFFIGNEVEKTPAFGLKTLFVVGVHNVSIIENILEGTEDVLKSQNSIKHIFFGANHSFDPSLETYDTWIPWEEMICHFLNKGIMCSLDVPYSHAEALLESTLIEKELFIPQIRIPLPFIKQYNYNTMIKIDDRDFNSTNPGVWCHSLHDLMDRSKFTDWTKYSLDKIVK